MSEQAPELVSARHLAERTGKSIRYFQKLAASGVTWASQPGGEGTEWLFNARGFERWLAAGCKAGGKWRLFKAAEIRPAEPAPTDDNDLVGNIRARMGRHLPPSAAGYVYFIAPSMRSKRVKIGWAIDPHDRLRDLQAAHPERLRVLLATPGTRRDESAMQRRFGAHRVRRDWFAFSDSIKHYIKTEAPHG